MVELEMVKMDSKIFDLEWFNKKNIFMSWDILITND